MSFRRCLSFVLDRMPCIPDDYVDVSLPKMRLVQEAEDVNAPDVFCERILQARLTRLWSSLRTPSNSGSSSYDPNIIEEQTERLRKEFICTLPPIFSIRDSDTRWDKQLPMLEKQRHMLRISVFVVLLHWFRPLLRITAAQIESMPKYKRNLLAEHRGHLVDLAISILDSVSCLHDLMGGQPTKFFFLSFYSFEPAILLGMHLLSIHAFNESLSRAEKLQGKTQLWKINHGNELAAAPNSNPLNTARCRTYIDKAHARLNTLRRVSPIGEQGARKIEQMISKLETLNKSRHLDSSIEPRHNSVSPNQGGQEIDVQNWFNLDFDEYAAFIQQPLRAASSDLMPSNSLAQPTAHELHDPTIRTIPHTSGLSSLLANDVSTHWSAPTSIWPIASVEKHSAGSTLSSSIERTAENTPASSYSAPQSSTLPSEIQMTPSYLDISDSASSFTMLEHESRASREPLAFSADESYDAAVVNFSSRHSYF